MSSSSGLRLTRKSSDGMFGTQTLSLDVVLDFIKSKDRTQLGPCAVLIESKGESHFPAPFRATFPAPCLAPFLAPFSSPFLHVAPFFAPFFALPLSASL